MNEAMVIFVNEREEMIEMVQSLVKKGLTFQVKQENGNYKIVLTGGF